VDYLSVIKNNIKKYGHSWWPKAAYHYTDIRNACNILTQGKLLSRNSALKSGVMVNDNASQSVISHSRIDVANYVRLYFRPLTPTQYYNEGYKPIELRMDGDLKANVPVPVFFAFALDRLLLTENIGFIESGLAGFSYNNIVYGADAFANLDFDAIYSEGPFVESNKEENRKKRRAELVVADCLNIDSSLICLMCRNEFERTTLLGLLDSETREKYQSHIKVFNNDLFYNNGFYITGFRVIEGKVFICFNDSNSKTKFAKGTNPDITLEICFYSGNKLIDTVVRVVKFLDSQIELYLPIAVNSYSRVDILIVEKEEKILMSSIPFSPLEYIG